MNTVAYEPGGGQVSFSALTPGHPIASMGPLGYRIGHLEFRETSFERQLLVMESASASTPRTPSVSSADETAQLALPRVSMYRSWFLAARFPEPVESQFLADYRRIFVSRMQTMWILGVIAWLVATLLDPILFPEAASGMRSLRYAGLAILIATILATFSAERLGPSIHKLTACASAAIGLCAVGLVVLAPRSMTLAMFSTLAIIMVVSTVFITTLSYEYSAIASTLVVAALALLVFTVAGIPATVGGGLVFGVSVISAMSLACTNTIEGYARVTFAQRQALERQSTALAEKAEELAASEAKARDANLAKSVFLSYMSHELRTPLNAVLGFAQLMERDPSLSSQARENLKIIERSGDHLLALINDVLAISKIEAGRLTLTEQPFDLRETLASVGDMIRVRTEAKGLQFIVSLDPNLPKTVRGDVGKLRQVLVNLLGNAVKFTATGGVSLRAAWRGSSAIIEVEDTGFGISENEIGRLFEAFAQTESGRKSTEGTGLGLAISRNFVRLMGGDIRVASELDRGTTFSVEVPLAITEVIEPESPSRRVTSLAPGQNAFRLLVVDDTQENRLMLKTVLESVGFEIREATNGAEAVEAWREWSPHLVWMDMRMPVMDGYDATVKIRELESGARCKIIALTASAFQHDRDEILANGCDDFVTKPFRHETIFAKLEEHLGARFEYEDGGGAVEGSTDGLRPERLGALPAELSEKLRSALTLGDVEAAASVVDEIREVDGPLAAELSRLVKSYMFDEVLDALTQSRAR